MLYLYNFEVKHMDDFAHDAVITSGIVAGHRYAEVLDTITEYFGEDTIIEVKLSVIEDTEEGLLIRDIAPAITKQPKQHQYLQEEK